MEKLELTNNICMDKINHHIWVVVRGAEPVRKRPQTKERACEEMRGRYGCLIKRDAFSHLLEKEGEKDKPPAGQAL